MIRIRFHTSVRLDLEEISLLDPIAATRIIAFLEQAQSDPQLLQKLTTHSYRSGEDNLDIKKWQSMHQDGHAIWRLRFVDFMYRIPDYRLIYLPHTVHHIINIMAICKRSEIVYDDPDHHIYRRIVQACSELETTWRK